MKIITSDSWAFYGREGSEFVFRSTGNDRSNLRVFNNVKFIQKGENIVFFFINGKVSLGRTCLKRFPDSDPLELLSTHSNWNKSAV